jgi:hypothetical protein
VNLGRPIPWATGRLLPRRSVVDRRVWPPVLYSTLYFLITICASFSE